MSTLDLPRLEASLRGTIFAGKLHHFESIGSTSTEAIAAAQAGAEAGHVYIADRQTAGRGRGGHTWHSETVEGLYVSVLLRPAVRAEAALLLSLATGMAVQHAIAQAAEYRPDLRWPNDIVTRDGQRKLGGILIESASDAASNLRYAVTGIGLNLAQPGFPPELRDTASSLLLETGRTVEREALLEALLPALAQEFVRVATEPATALLERFSAASSWVRGRAVSVAEDDSYTGVTEGLDASGLLLVRTPTGELRTVRHGGVRLA